MHACRSQTVEHVFLPSALLYILIKIMLWDASCCDSDITLDGAVALHTTSRWSHVLASEWMDDGLHEIAIDCVNVDNLSLFIGIVSRVRRHILNTS